MLNGREGLSFENYKILSKYKFKREISGYLETVSKSKDFRIYGGHKDNLGKMCNSSKEFEQVIKCLSEIMGI